MMGELDVCGVFVPALLVWGAVALVLNIALRAGLTRAGFFRLVWHAPLAELALYVMVFGGVAVFGPELLQ
jgi:hypothetical protein